MLDDGRFFSAEDVVWGKGKEGKCDIWWPGKVSL